MRSKQQLCTCITLFRTFFLPSLHECDKKLPNTTQKVSLSISKLRLGPSGFNPQKCRQYLVNLMKLNKIDEVWNSANLLFK